MLIAKEGIRELTLATLVLGGLAYGAALIYWPLAVPVAVLWLWVIVFFRDPTRVRSFAPGEFCSPADGTVTEITELESYDGIDGPAIRIGMFLSLFNVHINRMPCAGRVRSISYCAGKFLDARDPDAGRLNESNTVVIDPQAPLCGPVVVRQVAGLVARRIICHAQEGQDWAMGARFGLIKFGSRTELILPRLWDTQVAIELGDKVKAGLTVLVTQSVSHGAENETRMVGTAHHSLPR